MGGWIKELFGVGLCIPSYGKNSGFEIVYGIECPQSRLYYLSRIVS